MTFELVMAIAYCSQSLFLIYCIFLSQETRSKYKKLENDVLYSNKLACNDAKQAKTLTNAYTSVLAAIRHDIDNLFNRVHALENPVNLPHPPGTNEPKFEYKNPYAGDGKP